MVGGGEDGCGEIGGVESSEEELWGGGKGPSVVDLPENDSVVSVGEISGVVV